MSDIIGLIRNIEDTQTFGANGFRKRQLVITVPDEQYPQYIPIDFTQDKCDILDNYIVGQKVKVNTNIGGRIWKNPEGVEKFFLSLTGWRIEAVQAQGQDMPPVDQYQPNITDGQDCEPDDLPF